MINLAFKNLNNKYDIVGSISRLSFKDDFIFFIIL